MSNPLGHVAPLPMNSSIYMSRSFRGIILPLLRHNSVFPFAFFGLLLRTSGLLIYHPRDVTRHSTNTGETSGNKENLRFHATSSVAKRAWSSLAVPRSSSGAASRSQEASAGAMNDQSADIIRASTEGYSVEVSAGRAHACAENSDVTTIETNPPLLGQRCVGPADGRTRNREYGRRAGSSRISTVPRVATTITSAQRRVTAPPPSARALRKRMSSPVGTCLQAYREVDGKCESSASGGIIRADGEGQEEHRLYSGAASGDAIGARRVRASLSSSSSSSSTSSSSRLNNIPSKLMQSTAASRAGMYTPPAGDSVRSRFVPKRRLSSPSMLSSSSPSSSSPTSSSACSVPHSKFNEPLSAAIVGFRSSRVHVNSALEATVTNALHSVRIFAPNLEPLC